MCLCVSLKWGVLGIPQNVSVKKQTCFPMEIQSKRLRTSIQIVLFRANDLSMNMLTIWEIWCFIAGGVLLILFLNG